MTLAIVDLPPGTAWPARRGVSVDYVVVLTGNVSLRLEHGAGEEKTVGRGEVAVVEGQMVEWRNRGTGSARMVVVMLAAERADELSIIEEEGTGPGIAS